MEALNRLKVFEGIPPPYDKQRRMVIPNALRVLRLKPGRRYCDVGRLSHEIGWGYKDVVKTLEAKRKARAAEFYEQKKKTLRLRAKAEEASKPRLADINKQLAELGYA